VRNVRPTPRFPGFAIALALAFPLLSASPAAAQETRPKDDVWKGGTPVPTGAVAVVDGALVTTEVFLAELAQRYLRRDDPQAAKVLENLITEALVRAAAEKAGIELTEGDVQARFDDLAAQMKRQDASLDLLTEIKKSGVPLETFRKKLRSLCLLDRLARLDQKIPEQTPVEAKHHNTWIANRRKTAVVETAAAKVPAGAAATVDGVVVPLRDFARDYLQKADQVEIRRVVDMLARGALMDATLKNLALELADADLDAELATRKADFESKPQYQGIAFAEIVRQTTGLTADEWKRTRGFRLEASYTKLGKRFGQKDDVQEYYERHLSYFGPRLSVKHLLIRGSDRPPEPKAKGPPPQSMAKARGQMEAVAAELRSGKRFEDLVQLYSEDVATKLSGGSLESFTPADTRLHPSFVEAAGRLEVGQISGPIETPAGVHLIKLEKKDPPPPVESVEPLIRRELGLRRFKDAWSAATYGVDIRVD
jgi:peptidyl-prolyl cis-trans isomerase SurA